MNKNLKTVPKCKDEKGIKHSLLCLRDTETKEENVFDVKNEWFYTEAERDKAHKDGMESGAILGACATFSILYAAVKVAEHWDEITDFGSSVKRKIVSKIDSFKEKHKKENNEPDEE